MKYEKFEGSLGEFLGQYVCGGEFYTTDAGHGYLIETSDIDTLKSIYQDGVYTEKEEDWTDHLPVLCWVTDDLVFGDEQLAVVTEFQDSGWYTVEDHGCNYRHARPVTQEEIDKLIWKK